MADLVCFRAFGSLELTRGSRPLALVSRRKPLAVFAFLTLSRKSFHSRDVLQAMFWPESDQDRARHSLNQALSLLRHDLGPDIVVSRGAEEIGIAADGVWSDVAVFDEMLAAKDYAKALELYRGDLLPGFFVPDAPDFERWLDEERGRLRRAATKAAYGRAELALEQANRAEAGEWARRAAALAFTNEVMVQRSMQLLSHIGDRGGVIETYEALSRILKEQYGTRPAPETSRLMLEILKRVEPTSSLEPFDPPRRTGSIAVRANFPPIPPVQTDPKAAPVGVSRVEGEMPSAPESAAGSSAWTASRPDLRFLRLPSARRWGFMRRGLISAPILIACTGIVVWLAWQMQNDRRLIVGATEPPGIIFSPFESLGTIPDSEHLAPAIAAALTEQLAQVDAIELIADETSAAAAWTDVSMSRSRRNESREVFLVRGSVLPADKRIRVVISLIDAKSGEVLHTAVVERPTEDVFNLIDQVAQDLGELLRSELGHEIRLRRWRAGTTDTRAWELQKRAELERQRAKRREEDASFTAAAAKLKEADSLLIMAQAEDSTWDAPTVWRARVASDAAWLSFLPPMSDTAQARRWIRLGIAHAELVLERDSANAVALELRGLLHYWSSFVWPAIRS